MTFRGQGPEFSFVINEKAAFIHRIISLYRWDITYIPFSAFLLTILLYMQRYSLSVLIELSADNRILHSKQCSLHQTIKV